MFQLRISWRRSVFNISSKKCLTHVIRWWTDKRFTEKLENERNRNVTIITHRIKIISGYTRLSQLKSHPVNLLRAINCKQRSRRSPRAVNKKYSRFRLSVEVIAFLILSQKQCIPFNGQIFITRINIVDHLINCTAQTNVTKDKNRFRC